jgi:hypothetical protein
MKKINEEKKKEFEELWRSLPKIDECVREAMKSHFEVETVGSRDTTAMFGFLEKFSYELSSKLRELKKESGLGENNSYEGVD